MNVIFFGTPEFAVPSLKLLLENRYEISAVFTGQGPIKTLAQKHKIQVLQPLSLKNYEQYFDEFRDLNPDLCIVVAYGKIIPQRYLDIPKYGFINIHPSLLPKYRGPSPIQTTILNSDTETGITIMKIDDEIDHGPILAKREFSIFNFQFSNYGELEKELAEFGAKLLIETLPKYISGEITPQEQDHDQATFTKIFTREDGRINWNEPAENIFNQIRALSSEPGTWTTWNGKVLNIKSAKLVSLPRPDLGTSLRSGLEDYGRVSKLDGDVVVSTKTCYLLLKSIQLEGGKVMDAKSFINGHPDFLSSELR